MTQTTHVRIVDPVPVAEVFTECRRLLHAGDNIEIIDEWVYQWGGTPDHSARVMRHDPGVGLAAWLWARYAIERPLPVKQDESELDEIGEAIVPHWIDVSFDTTFDMANDVHAYLVTELGVWLANRGIRFQWRHEYTGTWYEALQCVEEHLGDPEAGLAHIMAEV